MTMDAQGSFEGDIQDRMQSMTSEKLPEEKKQAKLHPDLARGVAIRRAEELINAQLRDIQGQIDISPDSVIDQTKASIVDKIRQIMGGHGQMQRQQQQAMRGPQRPPRPPQGARPMPQGGPQRRPMPQGRPMPGQRPPMQGGIGGIPAPNMVSMGKAQGGLVSFNNGGDVAAHKKELGLGADDAALARMLGINALEGVASVAPKKADKPVRTPLAGMPPHPVTPNTPQGQVTKQGLESLPLEDAMAIAERKAAPQVEPKTPGVGEVAAGNIETTVTDNQIAEDAVRDITEILAKHDLNMKGDSTAVDPVVDAYVGPPRKKMNAAQAKVIESQRINMARQNRLDQKEIDKLEAEDEAFSKRRGIINSMLAFGGARTFAQGATRAGHAGMKWTKEKLAAQKANRKEIKALRQKMYDRDVDMAKAIYGAESDQYTRAVDLAKTKKTFGIEGQKVFIEMQKAAAMRENNMIAATQLAVTASHNQGMLRLKQEMNNLKQQELTMMKAMKGNAEARENLETTILQGDFIEGALEVFKKQLAIELTDPIENRARIAQIRADMKSYRAALENVQNLLLAKFEGK